MSDRVKYVVAVILGWTAFLGLQLGFWIWVSTV